MESWLKYHLIKKPVWSSEEEWYGRHIEISQLVEHPCGVCGKETKVLEVDSSAGEYMSFRCCLPCITEMFSEDAPKRHELVMEEREKEYLRDSFT